MQSARCFAILPASLAAFLIATLCAPASAQEPGASAAPAGESQKESPATRLTAVRSLVQEGLHARAFNELVAIEEDATALRDQVTADAARKLREEIRPKVGLLSFKLVGQPAGALRVSVAGKEVFVGRPLAVDPGRVSVKADNPEDDTYGALDEKEIEMAAGGEQTVELRVGDPPDPCRSTRDCAVTGRCFTQGTECVARSENDCKATAACQKIGRRCKLDAAAGTCPYFAAGETEVTQEMKEEDKANKPSSGVGLLVAGGVMTGIGALNLLTSPICKTELVDPSVQDTCLYASLGVGGGFMLFGIPMLVGGGIQRAKYNQSRRSPFDTVISVAPIASGGALRMRGEF